MNNYQMENLERQKEAQEAYQGVLNSEEYKNAVHPSDRSQLVVDATAQYIDPSEYGQITSHVDSLNQRLETNVARM